MGKRSFHEEPYDAGTLTKLKIFELYAQEWIPVFTSQNDPPFKEIHIFDLFCGPGTDAAGVYGSPLRILDQLRRYERKGMAGWSKVKIVAHLSDSNEEKVEELRGILAEHFFNIKKANQKLRSDGKGTTEGRLSFNLVISTHEIEIIGDKI